jgi:hypothetical protein
MFHFKACVKLLIYFSYCAKGRNKVVYVSSIFKFSFIISVGLFHAHTDIYIYTHTHTGKVVYIYIVNLC